MKCENCGKDVKQQYRYMVESEPTLCKECADKRLIEWFKEKRII